VVSKKKSGDSRGKKVTNRNIIIGVIVVVLLLVIGIKVGGYGVTGNAVDSFDYIYGELDEFGNPIGVGNFEGEESKTEYELGYDAGYNAGLGSVEDAAVAESESEDPGVIAGFFDKVASLFTSNFDDIFALFVDADDGKFPGGACSPGGSAGDDDCHSTTPACSLGGICAECLGFGDEIYCLNSPNGPYCDANYFCEECQLDEHCGVDEVCDKFDPNDAERGTCEPMFQACAPIDLPPLDGIDEGCDSMYPFCKYDDGGTPGDSDDDNYYCIECVGDAFCSSGNSCVDDYCMPNTFDDGIVTDCNWDYDDTTDDCAGYRCVSETDSSYCDPCTADSQCNFPNKPKCDIDSGLCFGCTSAGNGATGINPDCEGISTGNTCSQILDNVCTECFAGYNNIVTDVNEACLINPNTDGRVCNPSIFCVGCSEAYNNDVDSGTNGACEDSGAQVCVFESCEQCDARYNDISGKNEKCTVVDDGYNVCFASECVKCHEDYNNGPEKQNDGCNVDEGDEGNVCLLGNCKQCNLEDSSITGARFNPSCNLGLGGKVCNAGGECIECTEFGNKAFNFNYHNDACNDFSSGSVCHNSVCSQCHDGDNIGGTTNSACTIISLSMKDGNVCSFGNCEECNDEDNHPVTGVNPACGGKTCNWGACDIAF